MSDHLTPPVTSGREPLRLTYAELGERLHCSADAARQVVRRKGWTRLPPNRRGAPTTVLVPEDELGDEEWRDPPTPAGVRATPEATDRGLLAGALAALEGALTTLGDQLAVANTRADRAEGERDRLLRKLETVEAELLVVQQALREAEERSLEAALAGEVAPPQPATPEAPPSVQTGEGAPQLARDEAVVRRLEQAEDELAAVQGTLREVERALEAARAGDLPQSALRALVAAGGAVADGTGLAAVTPEAGKGRWRRWFRWQSRWDG